MHTRDTFAFASEEKARAFIEGAKSQADPITEVYTSGPTYVYETPWGIPLDTPYWSVTVEVYTG